VISCTLYLFFLVVTRILYALLAWGVFASVGQIGRIDAFLRRAYKCGISKDLFTFQELLYDSGAKLVRKMQSSVHCFNTLLPPKKTIDYVLRNSDNSYLLPQCNLGVFKRSFINWSRFTL